MEIRLRIDRIGGAAVEFDMVSVSTLVSELKRMVARAMDGSRMPGSTADDSHVLMGISPELDPHSMLWLLGTQQLFSLYPLEAYLPPGNCPAAVTITWITRTPWPFAIMSIVNHARRPCTLRSGNGIPILLVPHGQLGECVVFGNSGGQPPPGFEAELQALRAEDPDMLMTHYSEDLVIEDLDEDIQMTIVSWDPARNYQAMPDSCKARYSLTLLAVSMDGMVLQHAPRTWQANLDIVAAACGSAPGAIQWASESLLRQNSWIRQLGHDRQPPAADYDQYQ